jgi:alpha-D-ribose 1-methylphosphonate 5-triphosphate synthase subunit PhnH
MDGTTLQGGFAHAPHDAAHAFRAAMGAMARPGRIHAITGALPPVPLSVAAGALILTLCDPETGVHLAGAHDRAEVRDWIAFHTGAPITGPDRCAFALGIWDALMPLTAYPEGTADYPDRSATLIVERDALQNEGSVLTGPGIKGSILFALPDPAAFRANAALFPLGIDFFFTAGAEVAALPRSTRIG